MITRVEGTRYRCFERLGVDVGDFRVLVWANGSIAWRPQEAAA